MPENSDQEPTEEPTDRRIRDAVEKGQVIFSREVTNFLIFVLLALNIIWFAPYYMRLATLDFSRFFHSFYDIELNSGNALNIAKELIIDFFFLLSIPIIGSIFVAIFSSVAQHGWVMSGQSIIPKFEKISPLKGVKRLFSMRSFMEFIKGLLKITIVGLVAYLVVVDQMLALQQLIQSTPMAVLQFLAMLALKMVLAAAAVMMIIAILDYVYQRYEYLKSLKMTRQEIKEEFKNAEGDPQIKARLRKIRMERARKRMMSAVPDATAVIRNPTHYAVVMKYEEGMNAPMVVALGQDNVALKIIEIAEENDVPVVTNRALAKALFQTAELDQEIPLEHYQAVAEIISYIYQLKGQRAS